MSICVHGNEPSTCKPCTDFYFATRKASIFEKILATERNDAEDVKPVE